MPSWSLRQEIKRTRRKLVDERAPSTVMHTSPPPLARFSLPLPGVAVLVEPCLLLARAGIAVHQATRGAPHLA